jgi:hypothetical protein
MRRQACLAGVLLAIAMGIPGAGPALAAPAWYYHCPNLPAFGFVVPVGCEAVPDALLKNTTAGGAVVFRCTQAQARVPAGCHLDQSIAARAIDDGAAPPTSPSTEPGPTKVVKIGETALTLVAPAGACFVDGDPFVSAVAGLKIAGSDLRVIAAYKSCNSSGASDAPQFGFYATIIGAGDKVFTAEEAVAIDETRAATCVALIAAEMKKRRYVPPVAELDEKALKAIARTARKLRRGRMVDSVMLGGTVKLCQFTHMLTGQTGAGNRNYLGVATTFSANRKPLSLDVWSDYSGDQSATAILASANALVARVRAESGDEVAGPGESSPPSGAEFRSVRNPSGAHWTVLNAPDLCEVSTAAPGQPSVMKISAEKDAPLQLSFYPLPMGDVRHGAIYYDVDAVVTLDGAAVMQGKARREGIDFAVKELSEAAWAALDKPGKVAVRYKRGDVEETFEYASPGLRDAMEEIRKRRGR